MGIIGSPRNDGNTKIAMREALKAGEKEDAETELIHLPDYNLKGRSGVWIGTG